MTRTERSHSLRALIKDRSEARNGMDTSLPKGGAGAHNWGSLESEFLYETDAIADEAAEREDQVGETGGKCRPHARLLLYLCICLLCRPPSHSLQSGTKETCRCAPDEQRHRRGP
jgi:hypothetical protein